MKMQSVEDLMVTGLTYVLDFEEKISKQAGKMAAASTNPELKEMFEKSVSKGRSTGRRWSRRSGSWARASSGTTTPLRRR